MKMPGAAPILALLAVLAGGTSPVVAAEDESGVPLIDTIAVEAPAWFDTEDLLDGTGLSSGTSLLEITQGDVYQSLMSRLQGAGYLDAALTVSWPGWNDDPSVVGIEVLPGRRSRRGGVVFSGNSALEVSDLRRKVVPGSGDVLTPDGLRRTRDGISDIYRRRGYALVSVETHLLPFTDSLPDSVPGTRGVEVTIAEGPQVRLGSVRVTGLRSVRDEVVVREVELQEGDSLDSSALRRSISAIYGLGLFQDVRFTYEGLDRVDHVADLLIQVTERPFRQLDMGAGYAASPSAILLSAYWKHPNIWGNNQRLTVGVSDTLIVSGGGNIVEPEVIYEEPWVISTPWWGRIRASYLFFDLPGQTEWSYGVEVSATRDLTPFLELTLGYALERNKFRSSTPGGGEIVSDWVTTSSLNSVIAHDTRDAVLDPRTGHLLRLGGRVSGGILGGRDFYSIEAESRIFKPIVSDVVLAWRVRAGGVFPYGADSTIAPADRYFMGGGSTVRGYGYNALGPKDEEGNPIGGRIMTLLNVEARLRVAGNFGLALFADVGGLWESVSQIAAGSTGFGVGLGIRYSTPFGPLRLDYGFAPTWADGLRRGRAYLALGHPF
jgi:outer membrane protein insertion porin family